MVYVFLAPGFEEIEAITVIDCLRRCEIDLITVGIGSQLITGSHNITLKTDIIDKDIKLSSNLQMIILPGGMPGVLNLEKSIYLQNAIDYCNNNNLYISAICAAPIILGKKGLINNKLLTCYPGFESYLKDANISSSNIVVHDNIITAKSASSSFEFSFTIIEMLLGKEKLDSLKAALIWKK